MLNITSDNANNTRATINDILTITLETNETLAGANITALNGTFQMITENDTVTVNIPDTVNHSTGNVSTLQHVMHKIIPCTLQMQTSHQDTSLLIR